MLVGTFSLSSVNRLESWFTSVSTKPTSSSSFMPIPYGLLLRLQARLVQFKVRCFAPPAKVGRENWDKFKHWDKFKR